MVKTVQQIKSLLIYQLQQLVLDHPEITEELKKKYGNPPPQDINNLGHELILTADDLVYYKKASIMDMKKYFKL